MKIINKLILFLAVLPFASFVSCTDEEGEGGKATISGVVYKVVDGGDIAKIGDKYEFVRDTIIASDVDVYLIYGGDEDDVYDDKTKTSHNGKYEFEYLRAGDYSVFVYNDDNTYKMRSVSCGKKGTTDVDPIYMKEGKNSGKCGIVGSVEIRYAASSNSSEKTVYQPGVAARVYLRKLGDMSVSDTRTDDNANFCFSRLDSKTEYVVWVEDEQFKNGSITAFRDTVVTGKAGEIVKSNVLRATAY